MGAKMLIVRLRVDNLSNAFVGHSLYDIKEKTEKEFILDVKPGNMDLLNPRKNISVKDVNIIKYSEFFAHTVECDVHHDLWYLDGYVYTPLTDEQLPRVESDIYFWKHQLFKLAKRSLKNRNTKLKEIYYSIDDLSFTEGDAAMLMETR